MSTTPVQRFRVTLFLLCLAVNLGCSLIGWDHSLRERHESRQVQTAMSARYLQREGWSLDYPLPLFGPPWSAPFEFPVYQYGAALVADLTRLPLESAGRLTALLFFYLALPALFLLQEFLPIPRDRWWLLPALLLVSPVYIYYSRCFMIESAALATSAWFLLGFCRSLARPGWIWPAATLFLGVLAALTKFTTLVVFLVPAALFTLRLLGPAGGSSPRPRPLLSIPVMAALLAAGALTAGLLWTRHADAVKASNPLATAFVSSGLRSFVFGPLGQRLELPFWQRIAEHSTAAIMPAANAVILALFGLILTRRTRPVVLVLLLSFLSGPLIFANLHAVHDYYFYSCGVFALMALAVAWSDLLDQGHFPVAARGAVVVFSLLIQFITYTGHYLPAQRLPTVDAPELAPVLREITAPDDIVLVFGQDWNPMLAFFADRRAIMVVDRFFEEAWRLDEVLQRVDPRRVTALVVTGNLRHYPAALRPYSASFGLSDHPVLIGPDTHLYVAKPLVNAVRTRMETTPLKSYTLADTGTEAVQTPRQRFKLANVSDSRITQMMHPLPQEIFHPFGPFAHDLEQRVVSDAHAPTDFLFEIPPRATRAEIEFGILPGAYTGEQPTDGVEFQVALAEPDSYQRILFTRELRPVQNPGDRGIQSATVALPAKAAGQLIFRTRPGPSGSIASDWAFWARIDIR